MKALLIALLLSLPSLVLAQARCSPGAADIPGALPCAKVSNGARGVKGMNTHSWYVDKPLTQDDAVGTKRPASKQKEIELQPRQGSTPKHTPVDWSSSLTRSIAADQLRRKKAAAAAWSDPQ